MQRKNLLLAHKARNKGMVWNNDRYDKKFATLVQRRYGPRKVQKWAETPQNYIVPPMLVPAVSYLISYPAFKCLQYHPMPQTCVCTVIGTQKLTYEPYGNGPQTVQNRAKNTSNVHRSSHSYAHTVILYVVIIIQMHTIPTQARNMCVDGDR